MRVEVERKVAVPLRNAWERLSDLAALEDWAPGVASCKSGPLRLGAQRTVILQRKAAGKGELVETIIGIDQNSFTYDIEGGIGPLREIVTTWRLEPRGPVCTIRLWSDVEVSGPWRLLRRPVAAAWRRRLKALAEAFARDVEAGQRDPAGPAFIRQPV